MDLLGHALSILISIGIIIFIYNKAKDDLTIGNNINDDLDEDPEIIHGIVLGTYYGIPETKTSITVIDVDDEMIVYYFIDDSKFNNHTATATVEKFKSLYHYYPDGAPY